MNGQLISRRQWLVLCFLSLAFSVQLRMFFPSYGNFSASAYMLSSVLTMAGIFLCALPGACLCRRFPGGLAGAEALRPYARVYGIVYLLYAADTFAQLLFFLELTLYQATPRLLLAVALTVALFAFSAAGLRPMGRAGVLFAVLFAVLFLSSVAISLSGFNADRLRPPLQNGLSPLLNMAVLQMSGFAELALFMWCKPFTGFSYRRGLWKFVLAIFIVSNLGTLFIISPLGDSIKRFLFPFYTGLQVTGTIRLQRFDVLYLPIWVLCAAVRMSLFFLAGCNLLLPSRLAEKPAVKAAAALAVGAAAFALAYSTDFFLAERELVDRGLLFWPFAVVLPLVIILLSRRDKKRGGDSDGG